ncbi:putative Nudix-like regulator [Fulvivirga imtechensis AK7]|uniref:Putative Nudix-like regulator n=1 Tax=Fulvivirga imtechensis AK7 TaxID=1237149 RepID=L8JHF2_9BACT|nr:NUDIX domain-containing protein [Fulvivirga imtechensis]ELR68261.1 putative Nudix-like regulator [Fulvivirga imtechensis AK7]
MNQIISNNLNPHVSVDCVIFGFDGEQLKLLIIERKPKDAVSALPGDLIKDNENLDEAACRVLYELTGLKDIYLKQLQAFGDPDRIKDLADVRWLRDVREEPLTRVITIAYYSLVNLAELAPRPASFAKEVRWELVKKVGKLGFDHNYIVDKALEQLRLNLKYDPLIGFELLPEKFTLRQLQKLYEAVLDQPIDKRNFRKKFLTAKIVVSLDEKEQNVPHKPAQYYRFDRKRYMRIKDRFWF